MKKSYFTKAIAGLSSACMLAAGAITVQAADTKNLCGDANCDGQVNMADAVLVMQAVSNPDKYSLTAQGADNADVSERGDGITNKDALAIQQFKLGLVKELPASYKDGGETTTDPSEPETEEPVSIHLKDTAITVEGDDNEYTTVSGSKLTITHSGSYYIDGTLSDGQICVDVPDEAEDPETVKLFLNGVNITGKSAPPIFVNNAENTSINLVDGTENFISDADKVYALETGSDVSKAVIDAKDDLTVKGGEMGTGILNITANIQDGIRCNNDLKITGGVININAVNSTDENNGINGKESVTIKGGTVNIDAEGDGIKSGKGAVAVKDGKVYVKAGNDAVQADTTIDISGGLLCAGGDRGFSAYTGINITGGTVYVTATDEQVDSKLFSGTTQTTLLLNCIDDKSNEKDGMWKKANTIAASDNEDIKFTKKYKYVLVSDEAINGAKSCKFTNRQYDSAVTHTDGLQVQFQLGIGNVVGQVTIFDKVDPAGIGSMSLD